MAVQPPSTIKFCPVTYRAPSESINETAGAMSAGVPIRRIGTLAQ